MVDQWRCFKWSMLMVFGVEPELCNSYEAYFGSGTKLTVLGKFGHHVVINDLQENI